MAFLTSFNELVSGASATYAYDSIGLHQIDSFRGQEIVLLRFTIIPTTRLRRRRKTDLRKSSFTVPIQYTGSGYVVTRGTERTEYVFDAIETPCRCGSTTYSYTTDGYEMIDSAFKDRLPFS